MKHLLKFSPFTPRSKTLSRAAIIYLTRTLTCVNSPHKERLLVPRTQGVKPAMTRLDLGTRVGNVPLSTPTRQRERGSYK